MQSNLRDYSSDVDKLQSFLQHYYREGGKENLGEGKQFVYANKLLDLARRDVQTIIIDLDDVKEHDVELFEQIERNAKRYRSLIEGAIDDLLPKLRTDVLGNADIPIKDTLDIYIQHRLQIEKDVRDDIMSSGSALPDAVNADPRRKFPAQLLRRFEVFFSMDNSSKSLTVRSVRAHHIGRLIKVRGVIIRASEVSPLIQVATYTCDQCGAETYQPISGMSFNQLSDCPSQDCTMNKSGGKLLLQTRGSKFIRFQELRLQELSNDVPVGDVPQSVVLHCSGDNTRICQPGDHVEITGIYLPSARRAYNPNQGLIADSYIEVHIIKKVEKAGDTYDERLMTDEEAQQMADRPDLYETLAASICPEIYGHIDLKKALLLVLIGGTVYNRGSSDKMKIRGNVNVCLMGDPGVAKSQMLDFVHRISERAQYTTGRGSSSAGLTASVIKDPKTGDFSLEGGALVLADGGICCIDEFDKMQDQDRVAIHEVMEQQTVSIAKAGLMMKLNARCAILAAANPAYGRYNPNRSIEANIAMPASLLSRFDLLFLVQDIPSRDNDLRLANHISYVHQHREAPSSNKGNGRRQKNVVNSFDIETLRKYIAYVRKHSANEIPVSIPDDLSELLVNAYVEMRSQARDGLTTASYAQKANSYLYTSPRNLLALVRMSTALARLQLHNSVSREDVFEAIRLMEASKDTITSALSKLQNARNKSRNNVTSYVDQIYRKLRDMLKKEEMLKTEDDENLDEEISISLVDAKQTILKLGYTLPQFNETIECYEQLGIWNMNIAHTRLCLLCK
ncbi:hypothetical protein SNEBB_003733 [Seison nebaliae]|nr:hypothetical protein SNEBB_003733 [Seison nebaliae]